MSAGQQPEISGTFRRAALYLALAEGFCYPREESLAVFRTRLRTLLASSDEWPARMADLRRSVADALRRLETAAPEVLEQEYLPLFGPAALCPLTETSWGDAARLLGKAAQLADISGFYRAFRLQPREDRDQVPDDHLASELEFMSVLCLKEANALHRDLGEALEITRDAQKKFLQDHLATWVDFWAESVTENAPGSGYAALALAVQSLLRLETDRLQVQPARIRTRAADSEAGGDEFTCPLAGRA